MGDLVELPITLVQDHTLWEILREPSIHRWVEKASWIIENHGLVNLLVHPDYVLTEERLALYDEFLGFLGAQSDGWHALPRDVAQWWRDRATLECRDGDDRVHIAGSNGAARGASPAAVTWASEQEGRIVLTPESDQNDG
jgi:hypothetical protein